jgi:hypothetical protein
MKLLSTTLLFLFSALVLFPALSGAMAQSTDAAADPHQKLFETKCQKCHSLERVKEAHLTRDMVKPTVDRMKSKPGAEISENDAATLYEFLGTYFAVPSPKPAVPPVPVK